MDRRHLSVVLALALFGCSKDSEKPTKKDRQEDPKPKPPAAPKGLVELAKVPVGATQVPAGAVAAVIVQKDGTLSIAKISMLDLDDEGLKLDSLHPEPVAKPEELGEKLAPLLAAALDPPPPPADDDSSGGDGTAMALDEGKMGKKDSDRAEGQYKMKNNNADPQLAREQALEQAKTAGVLGVLADPCSSGFGMSGFGPGGGGSGWGTIGTGHYGTIGNGNGSALRLGAGLRARSSLDSQICAAYAPVVLADVGAPAQRVIDVLSALPEAFLAVTVDGTRARVLAAYVSYQPGDLVSETNDVGFVVKNDGVAAAGYHGETADEALWKWSGDLGGLGGAYREAAKVPALQGTTARIRLDGDVTADRLAGAFAELLTAGATEVAFGRAIERMVTGYGVGHSTGMGGSDHGLQVRIGQPMMTGDLDKAVIRRYIKRNVSKIKYCYEKQLLVKPTLSGTVTTQFVIDANGTVKESNAKGVDDEVSSCIASVIKAISFPKPKGGGTVNVTSYPFELHPPPLPVDE